MLRTLVLIPMLLCASLSAQATLIVDASGNTGDFLDIQEAIDHAAANDTLLVRPGSYSGFRMPKPLKILADPGAVVNKGGIQSMIAYPLPAGSTSTVRGLRFDSSVASQLISIGREATLILDSVEMAGECDLGDFTNLKSIVIDRCRLQGSVMVQGSTVAVITDSEIRGVTVPVSTTRSQRPAIRCSGPAVWISGCSVIGADAFSSQDRPGVAIQATGSRVEIRGTAQNRFEAGRGAQSQSALLSVTSGGELVYDPRITLAANGNAPAIHWPGPTTQRGATILTSGSAVIGTTLQLDLEAAPGHTHLLLAGLPRIPVQVGSLGALALNGPTPIVAGGPGAVQHRFPIPNSSAFRGALVGWQTVGFDPGGAVRFGNLTVSIVR